MATRALAAPAAFLGGFVVIVLMGKGVAGNHALRYVVPDGIFLEGIILGALNGLLAIGLVLIYRTNRIINFAQGALGAFAATSAQELHVRFGWSYVPAVAVGVVAAVLTSLLIEFAVIRRFARAPRLILTVATIGVAQLLGFAELAIPAALNTGDDQVFQTFLSTPFSFHFEYGGVRFRGDHLLVILATPVIIGGLIWFFRATGYGLAARAAAENTDRARLLGVRVKRVSLIVWGIAGLLSAVTAILEGPVKGFQFGALGGFTLITRALAAAVIGRMESLPITFGAAILITTAQQTLFSATGNSGPTDGFTLGVIVVALLVQRRRLGRLEVGSSSWQAVEEVRPVPTELRRLPEVRLVRYGLAALGLLVVAVLPFQLEPRDASLASVIMIYGMIGISLVILTGWAGNVSLGQWAIVGVGAFVAGQLATMDSPQDFFVALFAAGLSGAAVALVIGLPALRIRGLFLGVTTLAFAVAAAYWFFTFDFLTLERTIQRPVLFGVWDVSRERDFYFVCLAGLILALVVGRNLRRARLGRVLIAVRDNETHARTLGVSITRAKLSAFAVSGFLAALAGGLYAYHQHALRADRFPPENSILIFSMVVIGGMGSMAGALLGAVYVRGTQYFLSAQFQLLATGFGLLLLLLIFPGGLGQLLYKVRDGYLRWVAQRRGLLVPSLVADKRVEEAVAGTRPVSEVRPEELVATGGGR
jgi:branched-chain amino acid transport system permease protein